VSRSSPCEHREWTHGERHEAGTQNVAITVPPGTATWRNRVSLNDVNGDGLVTGHDVLPVINDLTPSATTTIAAEGEVGPVADPGTPRQGTSATGVASSGAVLRQDGSWMPMCVHEATPNGSVSLDVPVPRIGSPAAFDAVFARLARSGTSPARLSGEIEEFLDLVAAEGAWGLVD
jgi:hypothetical protein